MKKFLSVLASAMMVVGLVGCSSSTTDDSSKKEETVTVDYSAKDEGVLTYAEYVALPSDGSTEVVVEGYVQASQSYWEGATLYLADPDGAYFVYGGQISEEDWAKCVKDSKAGNGWVGLGTGVKVKVSGTKTEWSGEVEIADATVEIVDETNVWLADAKDVTSAFGTATLTDYANQLVSVKDATVVASKDANGAEAAFLYNWDGSGEEGSDLYFNVDINGTTYTFTVESYLAYAGSDVYEAVKGLAVGDKITIQGFLYYYNDPQLHVTAVTK